MKHKEPQPPQRLKFDGKFTEEIRKAIRNKRLELGLPYNSVSQYFSINWSTFRKWENGETNSCELRHRPLIEAFINGDLDEDFRVMFNSKSMKYPQTTPVKVYQTMEKIANTYTLCSHFPTIGDDLLSKIETIAFDTLKSLVTYPRDDLSTPFQRSKGKGRGKH